MKKLIVIILFPSICFAQKSYNYKNLVLEGGGVRGLAYAGVFNVLEEKGILPQIEKVGGSSAGSIAGMLVSIAVMIFILLGTKIAWTWYALIGSIITLVVAFIATLVIPAKNNEVSV